jgi:hypothetical protein
VGYERFLRQLTEDHEFRTLIYTIEGSTIGVCEMVVFGAALNGDVNAASRYIGLRHNKDEGRFKRKLALAEFKLKEKAVNSQLDTINPSPRLSFACLSNDELIDYDELQDKIKSGTECTANELTRLGFYTAKLMKANQPQPAPVVDFVAQAASEPLRLESTKVDISE